ncbi:DEHA2F03916p [Debaryomyces hansenii CBS767]|uniref:DEHA2F03916p n=1 Tax=Debaryomyces hansenii (strain ATCC 36239 / CBS 767 / BCRC 21394 / JCM 1990 / NBRC 0083 / IGC 2968) TaxID=284592 RepID=Q6BMN5_DEBHA|nr:DEHA2F03916p [Debaryomyces hansenii CBS767]CAG88852.1 DEHA2F03916p [Debaryomyces hansenii CBS767]|eukprot:XP_460536.1 DEHA2F03916p [Debaryomyces hansenii CBS767]
MQCLHISLVICTSLRINTLLHYVREYMEPKSAILKFPNTLCSLKRDFLSPKQIVGFQALARFSMTKHIDHFYFMVFM